MQPIHFAQLDLLDPTMAVKDIDIDIGLFYHNGRSLHTLLVMEYIT